MSNREPVPEEINPQKSEVHRATEDASSSPQNRVPDPPTVKTDPDAHRRLDEPPPPVRQDANAFPPDVKVKKDDSDVGGPIVIETDDAE